MTIDVGKDVGRNCYLLSVGMQRGLVTVEIDMEASQKKSNIKLPQDTTLPFLGTHLKDSVYHYRGICTCLSLDTLFIIARE